MASGDLERHRLPAGAYAAAGAVVALLLVVGGRYGFHRDELYFIEGGRHLALAQPDNPILVPLVATWWHDLVGGSLWAFRILPALTAGTYVLLGATTARELGGSRLHQTVAAVLTALTGLVLATGHLFSTTTFDMTLTAAALWLLVRALRGRRWSTWVTLGVVTGIAMEVKVLAAPVLGCCLVGLLLLGPRRPLASPRPWVAVAIALALAAPNLVWQARHAWPMSQIASTIAGGGSASSSGRTTVLLEHLLQVGPVVSVVLVVGVWWLLRSSRRGEVGWLAAGYLVFLLFVVVSGGKAYYPAAFVPALLAAATFPLLESTWRRPLAPALAVSAAVTPFLTLPLAPVGSTPFAVGMAVNPDGGETVGWEDHVRTVARVTDTLPDEGTAIVTRNYGEAGALARARRMSPDLGLPPVHSGHNAFGEWGPPPSGTMTVVLVGEFGPLERREWFARCRTAATLADEVDNEEAGAPVRVCAGPREEWVDLWPRMRHLG